jgi:polyisoprenoid-binding protein YceI
MKGTIFTYLVCSLLLGSGTALADSSAVYTASSTKGFLAARKSGLRSWFLPRRLSDENVKISFTLGSTWHTVHGAVSGVTGKASLGDSEDPRSVQVHLQIPVERLDTDSGSRDRKMRRVMDSKTHPAIVFHGRGLLDDCTPALVHTKGLCDDHLAGDLEIRDVKKVVSIPVRVRGEADRFIVSGRFPITWREYNVEDPSIFIASVDPVVTIEFEVHLLQNAEPDF